MRRPILPSEVKLPYPTRPLQVQGGTVEEYIIPEEKKAEVLEKLYLFRPIPSLNEEFYDVHEGKKFLVKDFRVTREGRCNVLVSPYYPTSGGTVIDWEPIDEED